jgi:hypothetical protein
VGARILGEDLLIFALFFLGKNKSFSPIATKIYRKIKQFFFEIKGGIEHEFTYSLSPYSG